MNIKKIIALYLRLSKHDEDIEEEMESNSIGNQRGILEEYVKNYLDTVGYEVREFVDDGFTGTSMDRPAMQTLLKMVEEGKIYTILVKDLSRFARNYLKSAYYMENVFPAFGVRFICVNDNYDSSNIAYQLPGMDMAFKGIIHDYYCKELSRKLKVARRQQVEKGKCIFAKPPYGYWKSETEKGLLVIDENTAPIVKDIFNQYLQGSSAYSIAQELNRRGIPSPNKRLIAAGLISFRNEQYVKGMCWTCGVVLSILRNQIYIGDMVGGKEERVKICDKNCRMKDREDWIVVQDTHAPIIDKEVFYQVQDMLKGKAKVWNRKEGACTVFSGKLICGRCYGNLTKSGEHKGVEYYACPRCRTMGRKGMTVHSDFLEKSILDRIAGHIIPESLIQQTLVPVSGQSVGINVERKSLSTIDSKSAETDMGYKVERNEFQPPLFECPLKRTDGGKKEKSKKQEAAGLRGQTLLADYEMYAEGLITKEEYEERRRALHEKVDQGEKAAAPQEKTMESAHLEKEVLGNDSKLTYEIVDYYVEKMIVNGTEDIHIEWREGRRQQA